MSYFSGSKTLQRKLAWHHQMILSHHEPDQEKVNISQIDSRRCLLKSAHSFFLLHHFKLCYYIRIISTNTISHQIITAHHLDAIKVLKEPHLWARAILSLSFSDLSCASAEPPWDAFSSSVPFTLDARVEDGVSRPDSCGTTHRLMQGFLLHPTSPAKQPDCHHPKVTQLAGRGTQEEQRGLSSLSAKKGSCPACTHTWVCQCKEVQMHRTDNVPWAEYSHVVKSTKLLSIKEWGNDNEAQNEHLKCSQITFKCFNRSLLKGFWSFVVFKVMKQYSAPESTGKNIQNTAAPKRWPAHTACCWPKIQNKQRIIENMTKVFKNHKYPKAASLSCIWTSLSG